MEPLERLHQRRLLTAVVADDVENQLRIDVGAGPAVHLVVDAPVRLRVHIHHVGEQQRLAVVHVEHVVE